jgi:L-aminopeptidase/D-esterase-like protein
VTAGADANDTLTAVPGITVGHATDPGGRTGCTVVFGPFRGAVELSGLATGTRELGALDPRHLVARIDALLLTGGSAFGLAAADGVSGWLAERGIGFETGVAPVPIVPAAVIFDLADGVPRPDAALGRQACAAASGAPVEEGRVGAGAGATVGKLAGRQRSSPGGIGSAAGRSGGHAVGALAVVNALGNVVDRAGRVVAGARGDRAGEWLDAAAAQRLGVAPGFARPGATGPTPGTNTTLAVVATDAPLTRGELARVVRVASTGLARRIDPVHTPFDGDVVFALSTAPEVAEISPAESLAIAVALRDLLEDAILRAVTAGR